MPEKGVKLTPKDHLLTTSEIIRLVNVFAKEGVEKIRFTGGEPLVKADIVDIIRDIKAIQGIYANLPLSIVEELLYNQL